MQLIYHQSNIKTTPVMGPLIALLLLAALVAPASADPLPPAKSIVGAQGSISINGSSGGKNVDWTPGSLSISYDLSNTNDQLVATASTDIGPGVPLVGSVIVSADCIRGPSSFLNDEVTAAATGGVMFFFSVDQIKIPTVAPITIPVYFEARGQGSVEAGYGRYIASAGISGVPGADFSTGSYEGYTSTSTFDKSVSVDLTPNYNYIVQIGAGCYAFAEEGTPHSAAQAAVDPIIRLDQAAFDATYGSNSFPLAQYYRIDFSPNVPLAAVPEPASTMILLGASLVGLIGFRRFRK